MSKVIQLHSGIAWDFPQVKSLVRSLSGSRVVTAWAPAGLWFYMHTAGSPEMVLRTKAPVSDNLNCLSASGLSGEVLRLVNCYKEAIKLLPQQKTCTMFAPIIKPTLAFSSPSKASLENLFWIALEHVY